MCRSRRHGSHARHPLPRGVRVEAMAGTRNLEQLPWRRLLPLTVFITGASVLIIEVLAVRVLSPYYGNTIFTVSSVISVVLLALSVGYYAGGALADRHPSFEWFFAIIASSGFVLLGF